jgi:hypothetical protein
MIFLVVVGMYLRMLWPTVQNAFSIIGIGSGSRTLNTSPTALPGVSNWQGSDNPLVEGVSSGPTSTAGPLVVVIATESAAPTLEPTSVPTATPSPAYQEVAVLYSYYNPELGGVNCHTANWDGSHCADTTASGIRWSEYVGRGVAIPPSWLEAGIGYGSILRVIDPSTIAGDYTVIDLCSMCEPTYWPDGQWRLDFLDLRQKLSWAYPVRVLIVSVVKPMEVGQ